MISLKHLFTSPKADGADVTRVKPSDWNAEHALLISSGTVLGRPAGATPDPGPAEEIPVSSLIPTGAIMAFGGTVAPTGWLLCQGQSISRTTYAALFAAISTNFGGSGTVFNVPDLRGYVPAGVGGNGAGGGLEGISFSKTTVGGFGGSGKFTQTTATLPSHQHAHTLSVSDPGHNHQFRIDDSGDYTTGTIVHPMTVWTSGSAQYSGTGSWLRTAAMNNAKAGVSMTGSISSYGGGTAHSITQPTMLVNYIIKT
jgi:microcystin-dependent protein